MGGLRGIAVVDVGYTNTKVVLFSSRLEVLAERKMASPHHIGAQYSEINVEPMLAFFAEALADLDQVTPIDKIVTSAHGACVASIDVNGALTVPLMDYASQPPQDVVLAYKAEMPDYSESYAPYLPGAILHGMQLFWQQRLDPENFARTKTILPLMQFVAMRLGGHAVSEISSMSCQSHLQDLNTHEPSALAKRQGWAEKYAPRAKAWDVIGTLNPALRGAAFRGRGEILAGVHDSNANLLRYLSGGFKAFTLLSTGTWIIGFDTEADAKSLDATRDCVGGVSVFGKTVGVLRFWGGREFELISEGSEVAGSWNDIDQLMTNQVMALPSFTDSGGPVPNSGNKGKIIGDPKSSGQRHALASLYCALMTDQSLRAIGSTAPIIVDGPFSQNPIYLGVLAALRPAQKVFASRLRDGTTAGAACLALMEGDMPPHIEIEMTAVLPERQEALLHYAKNWTAAALLPPARP
jgi:sugar (pentulose or hexulose) kinase